MDNLEKEFINTAEFVQNWENGKQASNDEKLEAYKYYKQATIGDINIPKPGFLNITDRAKWNAWNSVNGMDKQEAMKNYINTINNQKKKY